MSRRLVYSWMLLVLLVGCSKAEILQKIASPQDQAYARHTIDLLRQQRFADIEKDIDPSIAGPSVHATLVRMAEMIPSGEPTSVTLVGAHLTRADGAITTNLTFEYEFSGKWLLANVATKNQGGHMTVVGFNVVPRSISLEEQNRFTLTGKSPMQYLVLALAVMLPMLTIYALVACARTKLKGRKWPWILFILIGFGKLAVNWTSGQWIAAPLSLQLFSASAFAPLYGPWTLAVSAPVGAIAFLMLRRKLSA